MDKKQDQQREEARGAKSTETRHDLQEPSLSKAIQNVLRSFYNKIVTTCWKCYPKGKLI